MTPRRRRAWFALGLAAMLGCAVGNVSPDGELYGYAIGEGAFLQRCEPRGEAGVISSAPEACSRIEGAPILPSLLDGVGALVKALFSWLPF